MKDQIFNPDYEITTLGTLRRYVYGGKGTIYMVSPSGISHTYLFKMPINSDKFPISTRFIYCKHQDGSEHYIGMLLDGQFKLTSSSKFALDSDIVKGAKYIVKAASLSDKEYRTRKMKFYHDGRCAVCGRTLTSKWVEIGIGKKCNVKYTARRKLELEGMKYVERGV